MPSKNPEVPKAYRKAHKEEIKAQRAAYQAAHKEELKTKDVAYRAANKERLKARSDERYAKNKEVLNARHRAYYAAHKEDLKAYERRTQNRRKNHFKRKYGIAIDDWNKLFELQKGKCPVCKNAFTKTGKRRPVTHHCHASNCVHGLICDSCNRAEAAVGSPEVALSLYNYMMQSELLSYQSNGKEEK